MEEDNQAMSHKGEKVRNISLFHSSVLLFPSLRNMEIEQQNKISMLIVKEYGNGGPRKIVLLRKLKAAKENVVRRWQKAL